MEKRKLDAPRVLKMIAFPLIIVGVLVFGLLSRDTLFSLFSDPEGIEEHLGSLGWRAPFYYILAQIIQVFVFVVPGDVVQFAGGYLFGLWGGLGLSLVGIGIGSIINFTLARALGRGFVEGLFKPDAVASFEAFLATGRAQTGFFLLFAIPGLPGKDLLCYVAGISKLKPLTFLGITLAARIPGILGSSIMGSSVSGGRYSLAIAVFAGALVLFLAGFLLKDKIRIWIAKISSGGHGPADVDSAGTNPAGTAEAGSVKPSAEGAVWPKADGTVRSNGGDAVERDSAGTNPAGTAEAETVDFRTDTRPTDNGSINTRRTSTGSGPSSRAPRRRSRGF